MQRQQHVWELKGWNGKCALHTVKPQGIEWRQRFWKYLEIQVVRLVRLDHNLLAYVPRSQCYRLPHGQPVFPDLTCYRMPHAKSVFTDLTVLSHATWTACVPRSHRVITSHMPSLCYQISQCYLPHALEQTISRPLTYACEHAQPTASMFWINFLIFLFLNLCASIITLKCFIF